MAALATTDDLADRLGRSFSPAEEARAALLLDDASAAVRSYTGQHFTQETTTDRLRVRNGRVRLSQLPVTDVDSVSDIDGNDVTFTWNGGERLDVNAGVPDDWAWEPRVSGLAYVDVAYTHGYDAIPDDIVAVVCQIAGRAFGRPADDAGMTSETIAGYSYSVGAAAAAGGVGMLADERAVLDRYRRIGGMAWTG